jgi:hypothetical protein
MLAQLDEAPTSNRSKVHYHRTGVPHTIRQDGHISPFMYTVMRYKDFKCVPHADAAKFDVSE